MYMIMKHISVYIYYISGTRPGGTTSGKLFPPWVSHHSSIERFPPQPPPGAVPPTRGSSMADPGAVTLQGLKSALFQCILSGFWKDLARLPY